MSSDTDSTSELPPYMDDISETLSDYETDNFYEDSSDICDEKPDTDNTYSTEESEELDTEQQITVESSLCICDILCDNNNMNENCPICVENFRNCAVVPTVEDGLDEIVDELSEDIVLYDLDTIFDYNGLLYRVLGDDDNKVEIIGNSNYTSALSGPLEIPDQILYNNNTYIVTAIRSSAFINFNTLTEIIIPNSVTTIGNLAFYQCTNLKTVTIPDSVYIDDQAFRDCSMLDTLKIRIKSNDSISLVSIKGIDVFSNCPNPRNIVFVLEDGTTELDNATVPRLVDAVNAYKAVNDGDTTDYKWYGWNLKIPTFEVTVDVRKDNEIWTEHHRKFILKDLSNNESSEIITDLNTVKNGTYSVFDITDTQDTANGLDTGVTVTVNDDDIRTDPINYYTVTFYDEQTPYDIGTPQEPQIILKEYKATRPSSAPTKEGYIFNGWKTSIEGDTDFNFDTSITTTTPVYASWIEDQQQPDDGDDDNNTGNTGNGDSNTDDTGNDDNNTDDGNGDNNTSDTDNGDSNTDSGNGDNNTDDTGNGDNNTGNDGSNTGDTGNGDNNTGNDGSNTSDTGNGDNNTGSGDSNTGDTGNGDSNTDGGNDDSNTGSGNDNNNQNTSSENSNIGNSNNSSNTSSNTSTNSNTPSTQTDVSTSRPVIDTTLNAVFLDNTAANSITNSIDNNITDNNNSDEGNQIDSAKDNEPKTGEESNTGIYTIIAIAAGLVLLLLHLFDQKNTFTQIDEAQSKCSKIITIIPFDKFNRKWNNNNQIRGVLCTIRKKYFYLSG